MNYAAKTVFAFTLLTALSACQKNPTDVAEPKSYQYYATHAEETKVVAAKCDGFEKSELSTMSPSKQAAWRETAAGINCTNAQGAKTLIVLNEFQQKRAEAAAQYGKK